MFRNILSTALVGAAMTVAAPAIAVGPGGGGGGGHGGPAAGMRGGFGAAFGPSMGGPSRSAIPMRLNSQAMVRASSHGIARSNTRSALHAHAMTRLRGAKSQALMHASLTAISHASPRSALARASVPTSALPGLTTGLTVKGSGGATIGTVSRIVTGTDGRIRLLVATSSSGRTVRLAPNTLSISGGVVTTSSI